MLVGVVNRCKANQMMTYFATRPYKSIVLCSDRLFNILVPPKCCVLTTAAILSHFRPQGLKTDKIIVIRNTNHFISMSSKTWENCRNVDGMHDANCSRTSLFSRAPHLILLATLDKRDFLLSYCFKSR